jgi:hypothetical protein
VLCIDAPSAFYIWMHGVYSQSTVSDAAASVCCNNVTATAALPRSCNSVALLRHTVRFSAQIFSLSQVVLFQAAMPCCRIVCRFADLPCSTTLCKFINYSARSVCLQCPCELAVTIISATRVRNCLRSLSCRARYFSVFALIPGLVVSSPRSKNLRQTLITSIATSPVGYAGSLERQASNRTLMRLSKRCIGLCS